MRKRLRSGLPGVAVAVALLGVWELLVRGGVLAYDRLAPPSDVAAALADLARSGELAENVGHTVRAVLAGWAIAVGAGIVLGTIVALSPRLWRATAASVDFLRSLPAVALVPPAVLVAGVSLRMELMVIVYAALWPALVNTIGGIRQVPPELRDVARTMGLSRSREAWTIVLPAALPAVVVGARLALALALVVGIVAEMIGNPAGLGFAIIAEQQALQPDAALAYVVTIGLLGVALNGALVLLTRALRPVRAERRAA